MAAAADPAFHRTFLHSETAYAIGKALLFKLDPEAAHHLTLRGLNALAPRSGNPPSPAGLATEVMGLRFPNPVGLAAGMDKNGTSIDAFGALGFGHVEIGTLTPRPQPGNPKPRLFRLPEHQAIINRMGFNNVGIEDGLKNASSRKFTGILGINIGKNFDTPLEDATADYLACLRSAYTAADYITVNLSSPNTAGLRKLQDEDTFRALLEALKNAQEKLHREHSKYTPIAIKIAPDVEDAHAKNLARLLADGGADAVIATNTTISREAVNGHPHAEEAGGLSGAPVTKRSTEVIQLLHAELGDKLPIIGVGGILTAQDAREKLDAGAKLVQVYTGLIYRGPALVADILEGISPSEANS